MPERTGDRRLDNDTRPARIYRALKARANTWVRDGDLIRAAGVTSCLSTWVSEIRRSRFLPAGEEVPPCKLIDGRRLYALIVNGRAEQGEMFPDRKLQAEAEARRKR